MITAGIGESRSRKATFCDLNHICRRDAGLFSLARKAMLDRDGPDAFPFLALARIRSSRTCGAVNRRRVYSVACVGHLNRRLEWQRHDFSPGKLQTMPTSHARGGGDYSERPGLVAFVCTYCGAADSAIMYPKNKTSEMDLSQTQVSADL